MINHAARNSTSLLEPTRRKQALVATTIGNALEFFDFTVFSFFAILIGKLYFPTATSEGQLLLSVGTFGVGFIARPLGGILIGRYADVRGRKTAMLLTFALMALGSGLIAVAPTYAQIGVAAPLLIVVARLLQGFSAGGEVGVSMTVLVESGDKRDRGWFASWQFASQGLGVLIGATLAAVLNYSLSAEALESWGWRVPFALGILIAPFGIYLRSQLSETLNASPASTLADSSQRASAAGPSPFSELMKNYKGRTALGALLVVGSTVPSNLLLLYMPTYAIRELGLSPTMALVANVVAAAATFLSAPLAGRLSDRRGRGPLILVGRAVSAVLIVPSFLWLSSHPSSLALIIIVTVLAVLTTLHTVPAITMIPEMLPSHVRATGMAIAYSVSVALFGGTASLVAVWSIGATGSKLAPALYMVVALVISSLALLSIPDRTGQEMSE